MKQQNIAQRWLLRSVALATVLMVACGPTAAPAAQPTAAPKAAAAKPTAAPKAAAAQPTAAPKAAAAKPAEGKPASGVEATLAALSGLSGAEREAKLYEEAKKEGSITIYVTGSIDSWEAWKQAFEAKYPGVGFEFLRGGSDELLEKMLTEWRADKFVPDLVNNSKAHILIDEGMLVKYDSPAKQALGKEHYNEYMAQYDVNPAVFAWNTDLVKPEDAPKTWEDLLDPKWKGGKMALDLQPELMMIGMYEKWGEERGREYMRKLVAQDLIPSRSHTTAVDQLAAGEFPIVVEAYGYRVADMKERKGAPIAWGLPDPMPTTAGGIAITSTTTKPHTAALLYDWLLSKQAGDIYAKFGRLPTQPGAELPYPSVQKPMLDHPGLMGLGPEHYRKWFDIVSKDIQEIVQPIAGG